MNFALNRIIRIMKLTLFLLFTGAAMMMMAADEPPAVGSKAPDFKLSSQEGTPVSLKDFHGKWVVLYFYPKDMTRGCTIEAHNFQRDLAQYDAKKAVILGVSEDSVDSHKEFCTKESLTFKLLADPEHKVAPMYGSLPEGAPVAQRNTFIIDPHGMIRKVFLKVNPNTHSEELLATLTELQKGE
jgi:peroxiredoxin Q/BCP